MATKDKDINPVTEAATKTGGESQQEDTNARSSAEVDRTGQMDSLQQAYDSSTSSYELNTDNGIESEIKEEPGVPNDKDRNRKQ